jgi:hypothetical protein
VALRQFSLVEAAFQTICTGNFWKSLSRFTSRSHTFARLKVNSSCEKGRFLCASVFCGNGNKTISSVSQLTCSLAVLRV